MLSKLKPLVPVHLLLYSIAFGSTTYQSFFNGLVAFRTLSRADFAHLQSKIFPVYFPMQAAVSAVLLATAPFPLKRVGAVTLGISLTTSAVNALLLGPANAKVSRERHALIASEGHDATHPDASAELKSVQKTFARYHGASVLLNLGTFLSLAWYGVVIASHIV